ncbi:MAG: hypothetical protein P8Q14_05035, partial [Vicingaceae bacterium]|nr:hypothetical protein [Vicingaceae bacterium]
MKLKITLILTLLVSVLSAQQWDNIGASAAFNNLTTDGQDMTILANGQPVVAFVGQGSPNIKIVKWTGAAWISLPGINPGFPTSYSDLQLVSFENTLFLGISSSAAPGQPYMVYRLDGAAWTDLNDGSLGSINYTPGTVKLAVSDQPNDVVLTFSSPDGMSGDLPNAYKYDGASWDVNYGDDLNQLFANELPGETNSVASRIFHNGPKTYYLSYQTEPFGGASITNGAQNKNGGADELRLYKSDGSWEVLPFLGEDYVQNNPLNQYSIAGNQAGGLPYISYLDATTPHNIFFQQLDGANNYTPLPSFAMSAGYQVTALDMELDNVDFPYFAASDDNGVNKVLHYNGTAWDQIGSDFTGFMVVEVDVEVFKSSNKVYVLYSTDGGTEMKVFNHSPSVLTTPTIDNICQDGGLSTVVSSLELNDQDHDSVKLY